MKGNYINTRNAYVMEGEPMIFHCHHYNCFLQQSIEASAEYIDVYPILVNSAQEVVFNQMSTFFSNGNLSKEEKITAIEKQHVFAGFGTLDLSKLDQNIVTSASNHYAEGWKSKFGDRGADEKGSALFTAGFIAGALDAIDGVLGKHNVTQTKDTAKGDDTCEFTVDNNANKSLENSVGEGRFQAPIEMQNHPDSNVNYVGIREALTGMPIEGGEDGLISAFGVLLTRMYSNYYTLISYRFLHKMTEEIGEMGVQIAEELLTEAGHVCAFNTFGGIMKSNEWYGLILPMLQNKEDWVHGIVACLNSLGWGHLSIKELVPNEKLVLEVKSGYENNMHSAKFGSAERAAALFKVGATAGIMNLIYHVDISEKPELDEDFYNKAFKSEGVFKGKQIECRSLGASSDVFVAER